MKLACQKIEESLNKDYRKEVPKEKDIKHITEHLTVLLNKAEASSDESEEHLKNIARDFLGAFYDKNIYDINTHGRKDMVIYMGSGKDKKVGVIIEAKRPSNKSEMLTPTNPNAKALHELVHYYMQERRNNKEIKHLIATDIYNWYIFDAVDFEELFYSSKFKKEYEKWEKNEFSGDKTDWLYKNVIKTYIDDNLQDQQLQCTHINLLDYTNNNDAKKLSSLYKIFSPQHLLKQSFANDSNTLNKKFYDELLYIIGLEEVKDGGKSLIQRKKKPDSASLLENTIGIIKDDNILSKLDNVKKYGDTESERLFNVGLELVITWLNRILFLKLLEGQLIAYHKGSLDYKFMNNDKIKDFHELDDLFFKVLAKKPDERDASIKEKFKNVPYLNSSLFEESDIEKDANIKIKSLYANRELPVYSATVLQDEKGKKVTKSKNTLSYLLEFLGSYNFGSDSEAEIQKDERQLINASVLGLIFEKINGYKDGSFFTPGFITMYMCHETIRRAIIQKFNETKGWDCQDLVQLYNKIEDREEANRIINSLTICDPAVGSGHFLVSALNEIIAIKNKLNLIIDSEGKTLKDYTIKVKNDELEIRDENNKPFEYNPLNKESQRVQETLFHEKETIIENCLFGVDINPKSVMICRLRLWIELLKNSYYTKESGYTNLETLPNIDINIKNGNSLISRFPLDSDLKEALRKNKWTISSYRDAVQNYRNADSKKQKQQMETIINDIKKNLRTEISKHDKKVTELAAWKTELKYLLKQGSLFDETKAEQKARKDKEIELKNDISAREKELEEIKSNKIYENAFEWRFEFPEVLNNEGDFVGFDLVIGNPPYINLKHLDKQTINYLKQFYPNIHTGYNDISYYFLAKGLNLLASHGHLTYITSNYFLGNTYAQKLRLELAPHITSIINFKNFQVFDEASVHTAIIGLEQKPASNNVYAINAGDGNFATDPFVIDREKLNDTWLVADSNSAPIFGKIEQGTIPLGEISTILKGATSGNRSIFTITKDFAIANNLETALLKQSISSKDISKYYLQDSGEYLIYTDNSIDIEEYPNIKKYFMQYFDVLSNRNEVKNKLYSWYRLERPRDKTIFESSEKIVVPYRATSNKFAFDNHQCFNDGGGSYAIVITDNQFPIKYVLALLNSKLIDWYYGFIGKPKGDAREYFNEPLSKIPIKQTSNQKPFIDLVDRILAAKQADPAANTLALEQKIDVLVYKLYGLTYDEILIVDSEFSLSKKEYEAK